MTDKTLVLPEVENIYQQIDRLIDHLGKQSKLSQKDVEFLRKIIFHIDGLLNKLNLNAQDGDRVDIYRNDLINDLTQANEHLRNVLLAHEGTEHIHHPSDQKKNDEFFVEMIRQLKNMK